MPWSRVLNPPERENLLALIRKMASAGAVRRQRAACPVAAGEVEDEGARLPPARLTRPLTPGRRRGNL